MEIISQRQMRNDSSEILRRVEAGESFIVTNRGREVARLTPFSSRDNADRAELIARGLLRPRRIGHGDLPAPVTTDVDVAAVLDAARADR